MLKFKLASIALWSLVTILPLAEGNESFLLLTPDRVADGSCLSKSYFGSYGRPLRHAFIADVNCVMETARSLHSASMVAVPTVEGRRLVWLQEAGVDESIRGDTPTFDDQITELANGWTTLLMKQSESSTMYEETVQIKVEASSPGLDDVMVYRDGAGAIIAVSESFLPKLDTILPRFVVPIVLPTTSLGKIPVSQDAIERLQHILSKLSFNPSIASVLSHLNILRMRKDVGHLTGEGGSGLVSRHSFTDGAKDAADWIRGEIEKSGATCEQRPFLEGFSPNVICRYPAIHNTSATTILSAHYDSRGSFGSLRAPGGDDDGSGTAHLLAIARVIGQKNITFHHNFELVAFAGEEQGLLGSK
ncbi:hypothetical protein FRC03_006551, partial [Tulasnella sp. 419]